MHVEYRCKIRFTVQYTEWVSQGVIWPPHYSNNLVNVVC